MIRPQRALTCHCVRERWPLASVHSDWPGWPTAHREGDQHPEATLTTCRRDHNVPYVTRDSDRHVCQSQPSVTQVRATSICNHGSALWTDWIRLTHPNFTCSLIWIDYNSDYTSMWRNMQKWGYFQKYCYWDFCNSPKAHIVGISWYRILPKLQPNGQMHLEFEINVLALEKNINHFTTYI